MIRPDDAYNVLNMLSAAFPAQPMPPDSLELYAASLTRAPFDSLPVLTAAAAAWITSNDWPPTIHQLTDAYRAELARRAAEARAAEADRIMHAGLLPGVAHDPGYATEMLDVVREALGSQLGRLAHDHRRGAEHCPTCSRSAEVAAEVTGEVRRLAASRGLRPPVTLETYSCGECQDRGWVTTSTATNTTRPCSRCQPVAHKRWQGGHLAPGHTCGECRAAAS